MTLLAKTKIEDIGADQYLAISEKDPERLFSACDKEQVKQEYRRLMMRWHPDRNPDPRAKDVMQRIAQLYDEANKKIDKKTWEIPNVFAFETTGGKKKRIHYLKKLPFELGEMYIADTNVTFAVNKTERDLYRNAESIISKLTYPDVKMQPKLQRILPQIKYQFETPDKLIMVLNKDPDEVLLADLLAHEKGKLDPKHTAWIISRLHNLSCYLEWAGLTHNAMSVDTCFVSPKDHRISLLGGWWYAAKEGAKLKALPLKTAAVATPALLDKPIATKTLDLALIRAMGREILGDSSGMSLIGSKDIPKKMVSWVNGASSGDAKEDFKVWSNDVLTSSFGARRFVEMNITANDIYQPQ